MSVTLKPEATRAVVLVDGVARAAFNADGSFELLTPVAVTPTGNNVPTAGQLGFGKIYASPEQTITLGTVIPLAHSLGTTPVLTTLVAVCKAAELGYAVGDEIDVRLDGNNNSAGASLGRNASTLRVIIGASGIYAHNAVGAVVFLTPAKWRLVARAWA